MTVKRSFHPPTNIAAIEGSGYPLRLRYTNYNFDCMEIINSQYTSQVEDDIRIFILGLASMTLTYVGSGFFFLAR